ncbi:uncharacterized protein TNCV_2950191 [Trichonephila clavipes]|nr:uncharacterized protein TNCV_2950191 [Trichonephila clavipes]
MKTPTTFTNVSPILIEKAITGSIGEVKSVRKMRSGDLFLEVSPTKQVTALIKHQKLAHLDIKVAPHNAQFDRVYQIRSAAFGASDTTTGKMSVGASLPALRCGESGHDSADCTKKEQCVNCKGEHPAYSRFCPTWIKEKEITALKIKEKNSYPEARHVVLSRTLVSGKR